MLGELNHMQIDNLLTSQSVGRIGFIKGKQPYIIPVTYTYDGKDIYGQTFEGTKLDILRENSTVCFQVDSILNMANWQSVLVQGSFQELKGEAAKKAREYLYNRVLPLLTSSTVHAHEHEVLSNVDDSTRIKPVMYRIKIREKTGRFEKQ